MDEAGGDADSREARERALAEEQALQRRIDEVADELARYEEELVSASNDADKRRLKRALREADRRKTDLYSALHRCQLNHQLGEYSNQIRAVQNDCRELGRQQGALASRQDALEQKIEDESRARQQKELQMEARIRQIECNQTVLHEDQATMRRGLDRVDNQLRIQSLVFYGLDSTRPYESIAEYLPPVILAGIDVADPMGNPSLTERVPISVRFSTVRACEMAVEYLTSPEFNRPELSWSHNRTEMERVGRSRMLACSDGLRRAFGNDIELKSTFVRLFGQKYTAIDFAAGVINIGGAQFNIDAEVAANPEFEANPAVKVRHSGRTFQGCRRRGGSNGRGGQRGRGRGNGRGGSVGRGGGHTNDRLQSSGPTPNPTPNPPPNPLPIPNPIPVSSAPNTRNNIIGNQVALIRQPAANFNGPSNDVVTRYLPQLNEMSSGGVMLSAGGNYGSSRISSRIGDVRERYSPYLVSLNRVN
jgi:hypothetical protein